MRNCTPTTRAGYSRDSVTWVHPREAAEEGEGEVEAVSVVVVEAVVEIKRVTIMGEVFTVYPNLVAMSWATVVAVVVES